ncbi:energy transducer TonB [Chitinimonas sp. BJYL2]|uniref:energy transducer TonB family protein n=1 Tax=Chitinimonas sp. BJYL2 TaxID=2976696 RepID=UPI0022B393AF|nr:energy transducer TonB [Chitinimonas sp. BJYL2]
MDYAQQQRNPSKHIVGFGLVILLHVVIGYALMNGLHTKVIQIIQKPLDTKIIEEAPPPPPPEIPPPPPPDFKAPPPPPSFVPQVEVQVQTPPVAPTITATTSQVPAERTIAPAPAPVTTQPAPPQPPSVRGLCSNVREVGDQMQDKFVVLAAREEITRAEATVEVVIGGGGEIKSARVVKSTNPKVNNLAVAAVKRLKCRGQGQDVTTYYPVEFNLTEE